MKVLCPWYVAWTQEREKFQRLIHSGKYITKNNWYHHAEACKAYKESLPPSGRPRLEKGIVVMEQQQPTTAQAGPSLPSTMAEDETGADRARPPRAQRRRPAARKAAKKRKASELDDENGGELEEERKKKVYCFILYARSRLLMWNVFYRELGATAPNSTQLPAVCLL